jgi:hypothetical protein
MECSRILLLLYKFREFNLFKNHKKSKTMSDKVEEEVPAEEPIIEEQEQSQPVEEEPQETNMEELQETNVEEPQETNEIEEEE